MLSQNGRYFQRTGAGPLQSYLNMAPSQTLKWMEAGKGPSEENVEIEAQSHIL